MLSVKCKRFEMCKSRACACMCTRMYVTCVCASEDMCKVKSLRRTLERKTASSYILESISYIFCVGACVIEIKAVPLQHHLKYDAYAFDHIHVQ